MENNSLMAIVILILLMLAAFFLGWLLSRLMGGGASDNTDENDSIHSEISEKEAALEACRSNYKGITAKIDAANAKVASAKLAAEAAANSITASTKTAAADAGAGAAAAAATAATVAANSLAATTSTTSQKDDLKIIEGIGPKIEELLNNAGIATFAQLADTSTAKLNEILEAAGPRYQMHDPGTWAQQSALCRDGKWNELKVLQDDLNKGKAE
jgi:predicted flap endonuclease-1-like 5' DNA nuclease